MRRLAFHLVVSAHHLFCTLFYSTMVDLTAVQDVTIVHLATVQKSYLTGWNFAIQTTYCVISLVEDIIRLNKHPELTKLTQNKTIRAMKNTLFTSIVFPMSCFVSFFFWSFFNYDRELIYPAVIDLVLPPWYNHSLHSSILVVAFLEMSLVFHPYPRRKWGLLLVTVFIACYLACLLITYLWHGIWVYPMFAIMTWPQRAGMFVFCLGCIWGFHEFGLRLNSVIWGDKTSYQVNGRTRKKLR